MFLCTLIYGFHLTVAINDDVDQRRTLPTPNMTGQKGGCTRVRLCVRVTCTLIIHLKTFRLANINNKPEADVKNHLNKLREKHHVGYFQFTEGKKPGHLGKCCLRASRFTARDFSVRTLYRGFSLDKFCYGQSNIDLQRF